MEHSQLDFETLNFPRVLRIEPASQCNLSCSHCPTGTVDMNRGIMSDQTFNNVIANIEQNKNHIKVIVLYHGGEPLLNKSFFDYVKRIKKINSNFYVKTVSNGMVLTDGNIRKLIHSGIDSIEFSLDGVSFKESQYVREKSKTEKIISGINSMVDMKKSQNITKPEIYIATTQFVRSLQQKNIPVEPDVPEWLKEIFGESVKYKSTFAIQWPHMGDSGKFEFLYTIGEEKNECDHVISTITVRADGSVVPCCYDLTSQLQMGSINSESLLSIWRGDKYRALRASIRNKHFYSICAKCAVVKPPVYLIPKWG